MLLYLMGPLRNEGATFWAVVQLVRVTEFPRNTGGKHPRESRAK